MDEMWMLCPICRTRQIPKNTIMCDPCLQAGRAEEPAYSNDEYTTEEWKGDEV